MPKPIAGRVVPSLSWRGVVARLMRPTVSMCTWSPSSRTAGSASACAASPCRSGPRTASRSPRTPASRAATSTPPTAARSTPSLREAGMTRLHVLRVLRRRPARHPGRRTPVRRGGGGADGGSEMFAVFAVVQRLHEMLVLLDLGLGARARPGARPGCGRGSRQAHRRARRPRSSTPTLDRLAARVGEALREVSRSVRGAGPSYVGNDLVGHDLRGHRPGRRRPARRAADRRRPA